MRKIALYFFLTFLLAGMFATKAQSQDIDSLIINYNVFDQFREPGPYGNRMVIIQSDSVEYLVNRDIAENRLSPGKMEGFRVRIFFDNKQTARAESEQIEKDFSAAHPGTAVYRIYENPYFKVTVGDFRTKSEAMRFMHRIRHTYPQAFITREIIRYPPL
ncbi:MAG: SPOR domain-containing protein [Bacteroidales bacterium]|jgi:hypothetical protein